MIPSNSFVTRLKSFLSRFFHKNKGKNISDEISYPNYDTSTPDILYQKIVSNEITIEDLENDEIDNLILLLKNRISGNEKEMEIIKNRILNIKRKYEIRWLEENSLTKEYKRACQEVSQIIQYLDKESYLKLPNNLIKLIEKEKDRNYKVNISSEIPIYEQPLLKETKSILAVIYRLYLCN